MTSYDARALERIEPEYLEQLGLSEPPFADNRDPRFTYLDAERAQRLNLLQHMTQYSNLLLMVVGERGIGKSTLMDQFIRKAHDDWVLCQIDANTMMDADHLLYEAARGFGLSSLPQSPSQLQEALYGHLAQLQHQDKVPLLIIDDGHLLSKEALLAIFNLADTQAEEGNLVRIIMFCEPDIEKILKANDVRVVRERVTHTMTIPPFDEEVTEEYLRHRMAVAGYHAQSPFPQKTIHKIHKASGGVPQAINELAHMSLEQGDEGDIPTLTAPVKRPEREGRFKSSYAIWGGIAIILLAVALVYQAEINALFEEKPSEEKMALKDALQSELQEAAPAPSPEQNRAAMEERIIPMEPQKIPVAESDAPDDETSEPRASARPAEETPEPAQSTPIQTPAATDIAKQPLESPQGQSTAESTPSVPQSGEDAAPPAAQQAASEAVAPPAISAVEPNPVPASNEPQTIAVNGKNFTRDTELTVKWPGNEKTLSKAQVRYESAQQLAMSITVGTDPDTWQVRASDPQGGHSDWTRFTVKTTPAKEVAHASARVRDQQWVRQQPPSHFTVQLFGTRQRANAQAFIDRHRLPAERAMFTSRRNGTNWYSVIMGSYANRTAAEQGARTLPKSLSDIQPWIRPFSDIQAALADEVQAPSATPTPGASAGPRATMTANEAWLWSQDPRHYTLQLLGARTAESVKAFVREHDITDKAAYFHTRHNGGDWYVVVYGVYPDKQTAQQAIDRLPPTLKNTSPWIRRVGSVHAELAPAQ